MIKIRLQNIFVGTILGISFINALFLDELPAIQLGKFSVYPMDLIIIVIFLFLIYSLFIHKFRIRQNSILPLFLGLLLIISYIRGIFLFGVEQATNSARGYLYFYLVFMFGIALRDNEEYPLRTVRLFGGVSWLLFGLVIIRWILVGFGLMKNLDWTSAGGLYMRVVFAPETLILCQTVILALSIKPSIKVLPFQKWIPFLFIPMIILLQHRTIWVIMIVIIGYLLIHDKRVKLYIFVALVVIIFGILLSLLLFWDSQFLHSFGETIVNWDTLSWRIEGWTSLLSTERFNKPVDYLIGQPFGTGYSRTVTNSLGQLYKIEYSPHNFYIETFLNIGIFGLVGLVTLYIKTYNKLKNNLHSGLSYAFLLLVLSQMVFNITYSPSYEQGLLLSVAVLLSNSRIKSEIN